MRYMRVRVLSVTTSATRAVGAPKLYARLSYVSFVLEAIAFGG